MSPPKRFLISGILAFLLTLAAVSPLFTGCQFLKPSPMAAGQDAVIVNAQRIQTSSLAIYEEVTNWELVNRTNLPVTVSRVIDKYRAEFPAAWQQSRVALKEYQSNRGDSSALARVNAALSAAQSALLSLKAGNGHPSDVTAANSAILSLVNSIKALVKPAPTP